MPAAGTVVFANDGAYRVGMASATANSAVFSTVETVVLSVTVNIEAGRTYTVTANPRAGSTVAADTVLVRLREDTVSGTEMAAGRIACVDTDAAAWGPIPMIADYVPAAAGSKTFVLCMIRRTGTGNISLRASATSPTFLTVFADRL